MDKIEKSEALALVDDGTPFNIKGILFKRFVKKLLMYAGQIAERMNVPVEELEMIIKKDGNGKAKVTIESKENFIDVSQDVNNPVADHYFAKLLVYSEKMAEFWKVTVEKVHVILTIEKEEPVLHVLNTKTKEKERV